MKYLSKTILVVIFSFFVSMCQAEVSHLNLFLDFSQRFQLTAKAEWVLENEDINDSLTVFFNSTNTLVISEITVNDIPCSFTTGENTVTVNTEDIDPSGSLKICISYSGNPSSENDYGIHMKVINDSYTIGSSSFPLGLAEWVPYPEAISETLSSTIVLISSKEMVCTASGIRYTGTDHPVMNDSFLNTVNPAISHISIFESFQPVFPYQLFVSLVAHQYVMEKEIQLKSGILPVNIHVFPGNIQASAIEYEDIQVFFNVLEQFFGDYPFKEAPLILAETDFTSLTSSPSVSTINRNHITGSKDYMNDIVNAIAAQWWGNSFQVRSVNHLWITQGLKTYSETLLSAATAEENSQITEADLAGVLLSEMDLGVSSLSSPLETPNPFEHIYSTNVKGAYTFHMIREKIGDQAFFNALKSLHEHRFNNPDSLDLLIYQMEHHSGMILDEFIYPLIFNPGRLTMGVFSDSQNSTVVFDCKQYPLSEDETTYKNCVEIQWGEHTETLPLQFRKHRFILDNTPHDSSTIIIDPNNSQLKQVFQEDSEILSEQVDFSYEINMNNFPYELKTVTSSVPENGHVSWIVDSRYQSQEPDATFKLYESGDHTIHCVCRTGDNSGITRIKTVTIPENPSMDVNSDNCVDSQDLAIWSATLSESSLSGSNHSMLNNFIYTLYFKNTMDICNECDVTSGMFTLSTDPVEYTTGDTIPLTLNVGIQEDISLLELTVSYNSDSLNVTEIIPSNPTGWEVLFRKNQPENGTFQAVLRHKHPESMPGAICNINITPFKTTDTLNEDITCTIKSISSEGLFNISNPGIDQSITVAPNILTFPMILSDSSIKTDITLINPASSESVIFVNFLNTEGEKIRVEHFTLSKNESVCLNTDITECATVVVESDTRITGFADISDRLDSHSTAYSGSYPSGQRLIIPHIDESDTWHTYLSLFNSGTSQDTILMKNNRSANEYSEFPMLSMGNSTGRYQSFISGFSAIPEWSSVSSENNNISGVEYFTRGDSFSHSAALSLNNTVSYSLIYPHIDETGFWWTGMAVVNTEDAPAEVKATAYNNRGEILEESLFMMEGLSKQASLASTFFENTLPETASWIKFESSTLITGYELFGSLNRQEADICAGLNSDKSGKFTLIFPFTEDSADEIWTGIALLNPDLIFPALEITLEALDRSGTTIALETLQLMPGEKSSQLLRDYFRKELPPSASWIRVTSTLPLSGFTLSGNNAFTHMKGLESLE